MSDYRTIRGKRHRLCVAAVTETDQNGKPRKLMLIGEDERVNVSEYDTFITMYIPVEALEEAN